MANSQCWWRLWDLGANGQICHQHLRYMSPTTIKPIPVSHSTSKMIGTDKFWRVINFWKIVIFRKIWFCLTSFRIALNITVVNYVIHLLKFTADSPPMTQQNWFSPVSKPFLDYSTFCFWSKERTDLFGHVRYFTVFCYESDLTVWNFVLAFVLVRLSDFCSASVFIKTVVFRSTWILFLDFIFYRSH